MNMFFDTCVYHLPGQELLAKVIPVNYIIFASEMIGAVGGIAPETDHHFDDATRYIDQLQLCRAQGENFREQCAPRLPPLVWDDRAAIRARRLKVQWPVGFPSSRLA
jgi:4-oxalmesaconate hydratase